MSRSMFYGPRPTSNAFPGYSTEELRRDLLSQSIDDETRERIEAEIARRSTRRKAG